MVCGFFKEFEVRVLVTTRSRVLKQCYQGILTRPDQSLTVENSWLVRQTGFVVKLNFTG